MHLSELSSSYWFTSLRVVESDRESAAMQREEKQALAHAVYGTPHFDPIIKVRDSHYIVREGNSIPRETLVVPEEDPGFEMEEEPVMVLKKEGVHPMVDILTKMSRN